MWSIFGCKTQGLGFRIWGLRFVRGLLAGAYQRGAKGPRPLLAFGLLSRGFGVDLSCGSCRVGRVHTALRRAEFPKTAQDVPNWATSAYSQFDAEFCRTSAESPNCGNILRS